MLNLKLGIAVAHIDRKSIEGSQQIILPEPRLCKALSIEGRSLQIDVYVFSADELNKKEKKLSGFRFMNGQWIKEIVPFPDVVYDRCFYNHSDEKRKHDAALSFIQELHPFVHINNNLPSKLLVHSQLLRHDTLYPYLPHTELLSTIHLIKKWLAKYPSGVILKPVAGMQGKGILHLFHDEGNKQFQVTGRSFKNEIITLSFIRELNLFKWLYKFKGKIPYLIQPYFSLRSHLDEPYDLRVLMQKDYSAKWKITGIMARVGQQQGLTSNIHGGGKSMLAYPLLSKKLGGAKAERLLQHIHMISGHAATAVEENFGRFGELAFDFGVESNGKIWLLECNSKPGRDVFRNSDQVDIEQLAIVRPLQYALYLHQQKHRFHHAIL